MEYNLMCFLCKSELQNIDNLRNHFKSHNSSRLACHLCEISFLKFESLKQHLIIVHSDLKINFGNENTMTIK